MITIFDCSGLLSHEYSCCLTTKSVPTNIEGFETRFYDKGEFYSEYLDITDATNLPDINIFAEKYSSYKQGGFYNLCDKIKPDVLIYSPVDFAYAIAGGNRGYHIAKCGTVNILNVKMKIAANLEYKIKQLAEPPREGHKFRPLIKPFSEEYIVINDVATLLSTTDECIVTNDNVDSQAIRSATEERYLGRSVYACNGKLLEPLRRKMIMGFIYNHFAELTNPTLQAKKEITHKERISAIRLKMQELQNELDSLIKEM
jgi:hypothetical protein